MGSDLMTVLPVMGTALISSFKLLHTDKAPSGNLLLLDEALASLPPNGISSQITGNLSVIDWVHSSYSELSNIITKAQLPNMDSATMESALNYYINTNNVKSIRADNTRKYLNL
jgi:hypothetical protein